jgi:hypothetical protein
VPQGNGTRTTPYLVFPDSTLDDPAAYEGYATRLYRDARNNTVQIYIEGKTGRVVHVLADALNESIGFTVRPAAVGFGDSVATTGASGGGRWLRYTLRLRDRARIGQFLLGSMRIERDFGYAGRVRDSLDAPPFVVPELASLAARLEPSFSLNVPARDRWVLRVAQTSPDGKYHLWLTIAGNARQSRATLANRVVTVEPLAGGAVELAVAIATDAPALHPLTRAAIFTREFIRWADSLRDPRLEREIRGVELLASREKLMAGLPNYATYFGRDMFMTALLMQPIWADTMAEFVVAAALAKLGPDGEVSHEEALGGQAIRESVAESGKVSDATRENYWMLDDDFQLAVVAARYFANPGVPLGRKRRFAARWGQALRRNLAYVARLAGPYAGDPRAVNLVGFRRDPDGWWHPGSWRDSRVGYAGGRFAFDVNVVWVPAALRSIATIDSALRAIGQPGIANVADIARAAGTWGGSARHFAVALSGAEVAARVARRLAALPRQERVHWERVLARLPALTDSLRFPAVSLDSAGHPIPVMSTDPAMWLLLDSASTTAWGVDALVRTFLLPYPLGLWVDEVGPVAANDAYADSSVWRMFEHDLYHSPRVVWGREVNMLLAALAHRGRAAAIDSVASAAARSGFQHAELWSYRVEANAVLHPIRYGTGSDVQLWTLTDLAVRFLLARLPGLR